MEKKKKQIVYNAHWTEQKLHESWSTVGEVSEGVPLQHVIHNDAASSFLDLSSKLWLYFID